MGRFHAVAAFVVLTLVSTPGWPMTYSEHAKVTCEAVQFVCGYVDGEATTDAKRKRAELFRTAICTKGCADEAAAGLDAKQSAEQLAQERPDLFECNLHFGDAVALIDYSNNADGLAAKSCDAIARLKDELLNTAWQSLLADEQFCPLNHQAYANSHQNALGLARLAADKDDVDALRRALFQEARAVHIMEDAFCAGHMYTTLRDDLDPFVVTSVHDEYNDRIVRMRNGLPTPEFWNALGEGHILELGNEDNYQKSVSAVTLSLREVALAFLRGAESEYRENPPPADYMPVCPTPDQRDHHTFELRGEYRHVSGFSGEGNPIRRTMFSEVAVSAVFPMSEHWTLSVGPELGLYHRRGMTEQQYLSGEHHDETVRSLGGTTSFQFSTSPWKRLFRLNVAATMHGGYLRTSTTSPSTLRWLDGADLSFGPEILGYYLGLRAGVMAGFRQSGTQDQWMGVLGPYVTAASRW